MKLGTTRQTKTLFTLVVALLAIFGSITLLTRARILPDMDQGMGVVLTLNYDDGTCRTVDPTDQISLWVTGMKITDSFGKTVNSVEARMKYKVDWEGTLTGYSFTGGLNVKVDGTRRRTATVSNPSKINHGFWEDILSTTITKSQLESWCDVAGTHTMRIEGALTVSLNFEGGSSDSKTASYYVDWKFGYEPDAPIGGTIVSFSISTYATPDWM